jgi:hypothetical protein
MSREKGRAEQTGLVTPPLSLSPPQPEPPTNVPPPLAPACPARPHLAGYAASPLGRAPCLHQFRPR